LLQKAVGSEKRPLSWVVGEQRVYRQPPPSLRDSKRPQRQETQSYPPPDRV